MALTPLTNGMSGSDCRTNINESFTQVDANITAIASKVTSGGALGTPSSGTLTNCTGLPISGLTSFVGLPVDLGYACSDEVTALTTGEKVVFYASYAFNLTSVECCVTTAPTGSALTVDVESPAGTTLLSAVASISASAFTATGSASGGTQSIAKGARVSIDIDQIGLITAGTGLKVTLIGTRA